MVDIPDDVVKRAFDELVEIMDDAMRENHEEEIKDCVRAAGRVFVEWDRDRIYALIQQYLGQEDLLDYPRSHNSTDC